MEEILLLLQSGGPIAVGILYYFLARERFENLIESICNNKCKPMWKQRLCEMLCLLPVLGLIAWELYRQLF